MRRRQPGSGSALLLTLSVNARNLRRRPAPPARALQYNVTMPLDTAFKRSPEHDWTPERIAKLGTDDIRQLRTNAESLGASEIVELCEEALKARPKARSKRGSAGNPPKHARHLISRDKAFQARGAFLRDSGRSWSAVRKSDGAVVMSLWAAAVVTSGGTCSQLLWAPNQDGSRYVS